MARNELKGNLDRVKLDANLKDSTCTKPITSARVWLEVRDIMSRDVATISPDETVISASVLMAGKHVSCAVVVDNAAVAGILTETDLLKTVAAEGIGVYEEPVAAVMSKSVVSVSASMSVLDASRLIQSKHLKRLPVVTDGRLVGIVTQTDLTRALAHYGTWRDVVEIMNSNVCQLQCHVSVAEAANAMSSRKISSVVAMRNEEAVGIFTQRDFFTKVIAKNKDPQYTRIEEVMTSPPISVPPTYSVHSACRTMEDLRIRRLLVMEGKKLLGIVTQTDMFAAIKNKLQAEEEKNIELLEQSESCTFTTDLEGRVTYVNPAFVRLFEISDPQQLLNRPFLSEQFWVDPTQRALFMGGYTNWRFDSSELSLKSAKGKNLYVSVFSNFTTDAHEVINGRQGIVHDQTQRTEAAKKQDELIRRLKKTNSELERFAYVLSHDLKTPLRGIVTLANWIGAEYTDKMDDEGREKLELLRRRAHRSYDMVGGILDYCRMSDTNMKWADVDLRQRIAGVIDLLEVSDHIEITLEGEFPIVRGNPKQITQIFRNLLCNAINHIDKPRGHISIRCTDETTAWKLSISDNGSGIHQKHFDRIFQMFQTLYPTDESKSTGIGLALVKKSVEIHGGTIWVESVRGQGSTFLFTLPKRRVKVRAAELDVVATA